MSGQQSADGACAGCGVALAPSRNPGPPRKWCSDRCRKQTLYGGSCEVCGGETNGSNGTAATVCGECRRWPDEAIIDAMQRWAEAHGGIPPTCTDWRRAGVDHPAASVARGRWNELLLRAGFALRCDRRPETQQWIEDQLRAGVPTVVIARALGVGASNIHQRMYYRGLRVGELRKAARA